MEISGSSLYVFFSSVFLVICFQVAAKFHCDVFVFFESEMRFVLCWNVCIFSKPIFLRPVHVHDICLYVMCVSLYSDWAVLFSCLFCLRFLFVNQYNYYYYVHVMLMCAILSYTVHVSAYMYDFVYRNCTVFMLFLSRFFLISNNSVVNKCCVIYYLLLTEEYFYRSFGKHRGIGCTSSSYPRILVSVCLSLEQRRRYNSDVIQSLW
jgi:hypothetical protein